MLNYVLIAFFTTMPFLVAILLALALCLLSFGCYHQPVVALWLVMAVLLWEAASIFLPGLNLGLYLYPTDIVFAILGLTGGLRAVGDRSYRAIPRSMALLGAVMTASFIIGLAKYGSSAGVDFRNDFYFLIGTAYFATITPTPALLRQFARAWIWAALFILCVVGYRWTADAFGLDWFDPLWHYIDKSGVAFRVVDSAQALFLGQALILLVYATTVGGGLRNWRWLMPLLGLTVVALQHRSVWVATFVPLVLVIFITGKARGRAARGLGVILLVVAVMATPLIGGESDALTESVALSAEKGAQLDQGTFGDRVNSWQQLLGGWVHSNPYAYAFGNPYGSGFARVLTGTGEETNIAPHNYYVQTLLNSGLSGLLALAATYFFALRWLGRDNEKQRLSSPEVPASAMFALLVCQLLYFIPYSPHYEQGIVLGIALSLVRDRFSGWHAPTLEANQS